MPINLLDTIISQVESILKENELELSINQQEYRLDNGSRIIYNPAPISGTNNQLILNNDQSDIDQNDGFLNIIYKKLTNDKTEKQEATITLNYIRISYTVVKSANNFYIESIAVNNSTYQGEPIPKTEIIYDTNNNPVIALSSYNQYSKEENLEERVNYYLQLIQDKINSLIDQKPLQRKKEECWNIEIQYSFFIISFKSLYL